ncbi:hypothetical protein D3C78_697770 [compost metagenome]
MAKVAIERIEAQVQRPGQGPQQTAVGPAPITALHPQQGQQGIGAQTPGRRLAEHMQAIADLRLLEVAQVGVQARQPHRGIVQRTFDLQLAVDMVVAHQRQDVALQLAGPARVEQLRLVVLVGQQFQVTQGPIGFGAGQRRHQVVDDHRLGAALGLGTLARVVDDERVDVRQRAEQGVRPAAVGQADALARQPFQVAVLADMDQRIGGKAVTQPEVERQVSVRRHQVGVMVDRALVQLVTTGRLDADEGQAVAQAGDHHPPAAEHRVLARLAPAFAHGYLVGLGQGGKRRQVIVQGHALHARAQVEAVQVIADATEQGLDQRRTAGGQGGQGIALRLQGAQDIQRRGRGVEPHAIADAAIAGRVVGEDQRHTLLCVG